MVKNLLIEKLSNVEINERFEIKKKRLVQDY